MLSILVTVFSARVMPLDALMFNMGSPEKKCRVDRDAGIVDKNTGQPEFWSFPISLMKIRSVEQYVESICCIYIHKIHISALVSSLYLANCDSLLFAPLSQFPRLSDNAAEQRSPLR